MKERLSIIIGVVLFLVFYIPSAIWNTLTPDDLYFAHNLKLGGVSEAVLFEYNNWSTRFTSVYFNQLFLSWNWKFMVPFRDLLTLSFLVLGVHLSLKRYGRNKDVFLQSFLYSIVIFFSLLHIQESWFWHCASFTYGWTIGLSFILLGVLRREFKGARFLVVSLISFYIGGASAPIAIMLIILTLLGFLFKSKIHKSYLLLILIFCGLSFTILMLGDGNVVRKSMLPEPSFVKSLWINVKSLGRLYLILIPSKLLWMIPGALIASLVPDSWKFIKWNKQQALMIFAGLFILTFLYHWPIAYTMGEIAADRALAIVFVAHQVFLIIVFWSINLSKIKVVRWVFPIAMIFFVVRYLPIHREYNLLVSARYDLLNENKSNEIILNRLPESGFYRDAEVTEYGHLQKYFELKDQPSLKD